MGGDGGTPICVAVVEALAAVDGTTPGDLDYSLHDHVHTDALELLDRDGKGEWELTFQVPDHEVTVCHDGSIEIDDEEVDTRG